MITDPFYRTHVGEIAAVLREELHTRNTVATLFLRCSCGDFSVNLEDFESLAGAQSLIDSHRLAVVLELGS